MKKPKNITKNDWQLLQSKYKNLDKVVKKINNNYPVQYLIGNVDFYGNIIKVNPSVLIPRFETESLVENTIQYIKKLNLENASLLDIGTGSGCISIALKKENSSLEVTAIDNSFRAIQTAKRNARLNKVKINFILKDLFKYDLVNNYDVIISNPPYLTRGDIVDVKTMYEPQKALYVKNNPLEFYEEIFKIGQNHLNKKGLIALEIDEEQGKNLKIMAKEFFPKSKIKVLKDLAGKDRFMFIEND
jgi:release factor glutamine methyltransferase